MEIDYRDILKKFVEEKVRFAVIGGFAAVAHGVVRVTMDLDLAITLKAEDLRKTWEVLDGMGFRIRQPIAKEVFIDPEKLTAITEEKNAKAISFIHSSKAYLVVDILFNKDFQFSDKDIVFMNLFGCKCPVVGIDKLVQLKLKAGRKKDLEDVRELKKIEKK